MSSQTVESEPSELVFEDITGPPLASVGRTTSDHHPLAIAVCCREEGTGPLRKLHGSSVER